MQLRRRAFSLSSPRSEPSEISSPWRDIRRKEQHDGGQIEILFTSRPSSECHFSLFMRVVNRFASQNDHVKVCIPHFRCELHKGCKQLPHDSHSDLSRHHHPKQYHGLLFASSHDASKNSFYIFCSCDHYNKNGRSSVLFQFPCSLALSRLSNMFASGMSKTFATSSLSKLRTSVFCYCEQV